MKQWLRMLLPGVVAVTVLVGARAWAQEGGNAPSAGMTNLFDHYVVGGGWITWFLLIPLSVASAALTVEYCLSIRRVTVIPEATLEQLGDSLDQKRYAEAVAFAAGDSSMLAQVVHQGLLEAAGGFEAMVQAMEEAMEEYGARLMRKIEYLNIIGNVSPMIGLFGTVVGMIRLFASIGDFGGNLNAGEIASALSIALVTTYWGLLIAIPALSVFALFRNRIERLTTECEETAERLLSVFKPGVPSAGGETTAGILEARVRKPLIGVGPASAVSGARMQEG